MSDSRPLITSLPLDGRICVLTGGRGFLGQKFTSALLSAGAKVAILDIAPIVDDPLDWKVFQLNAGIWK